MRSIEAGLIQSVYLKFSFWFIHLFTLAFLFFFFTMMSLFCRWRAMAQLVVVVGSIIDIRQAQRVFQSRVLSPPLPNGLYSSSIRSWPRPVAMYICMTWKLIGRPPADTCPRIVQRYRQRTSYHRPPIATISSRVAYSAKGKPIWSVVVVGVSILRLKTVPAGFLPQGPPVPDTRTTHKSRGI